MTFYPQRFALESTKKLTQKCIELYKLYCEWRMVGLHLKTLNKFSVSLELDLCWNWLLLRLLNTNF